MWFAASCVVLMSFIGQASAVEPLPLASTLPSLTKEWVATDIHSFGPFVSDGRRRGVVVAQPPGYGTLVGIDLRTGRLAWSGRKLEVMSLSGHRMVGDDLLYFTTGGELTVASIETGAVRFTVPGTKCQRGSIDVIDHTAVVGCTRLVTRYVLAPDRGTLSDELYRFEVDLKTGATTPLHSDESGIFSGCGRSICVADRYNKNPLVEELVGTERRSGKVRWRLEQSESLLAVRGDSLVTLDGHHQVVIRDAMTGAERWRAKTRPYRVYDPSEVGPVLVDERSVSFVGEAAIETRDVHSGIVLVRHPLPNLAPEIDVTVQRWRGKLVAFIEGGDLGPGYLVIYDGAHEQWLDGAGHGSVIDDHLLVKTDPYTDEWTSYGLSQRVAPVRVRLSNGDRVREMLERGAGATHLAELRAIPDHESILTHLVQTEDGDVALDAVNALTSLKSPKLYDLCVEILRTRATSTLVELALLTLDELGRSVPLDALAVHVPALPARQNTFALLLARGGEAELRALDPLFAGLPGRVGWQHLCDGLDDAMTGTGEAPAECHRGAVSGATSIAFSGNTLWLRRDGGPTRIGALKIDGDPSQGGAATYELTTFAITERHVEVDGIGHAVDGARVPITLDVALDAVLHDSDGDGLPDTMERCLGTSPTQADTDGDGVLDGVDGAPTLRMTPPDPRSEIVRSALMYLARFEEPSLWTVAIVDAAPGFRGVMQGVAATGLTSEPARECGLSPMTVRVHPENPPKGDPVGRRSGDVELRIEALKSDGTHASLDAVFDYAGGHGGTRRLELVKTTHGWRVTRYVTSGDWVS